MAAVGERRWRDALDEAAVDIVARIDPTLREAALASLDRIERRRQRVMAERRRRFLERIDRGEVTV